MRDHHYFVYIMASKSRVLYTEVSNSVRRRAWEHKNDLVAGFSSKYKCHRLVYFEQFRYVGNAIRRETQIKGWLRSKKIVLIESVNPAWEDLSEAWGQNPVATSGESKEMPSSCACTKTAGSSLHSE